MHIGYKEDDNTQSADFLRHSADNTETADKLPINCRQTANKLPINEQEKVIYKYIMENGSVTTAQTTQILGIKQRRARDILAKMVEKSWLKKEGTYRSTVYVINTERVQ